MKPNVHARNSVKRYGGKEEDYLPIHDWFDSTKAAWADTRHRAVLHSTFGCYLAEQVFGHEIRNSDGRLVQVRSIAEDHISEDFAGRIPTLQDWFEDLPVKGWMRGIGQKKHNIKKGLDYD